MPTFVLIFEDDQTVPIEAELRARHVAYLQSLGEYAILAGPTFDTDQKVTGRVIVGEFASLDNARAFADAEPLVIAGRSRVSRAQSMVVVQKDGVFTPVGG